MSKKIVTFGEIMLRLTPPDNLRIQQSRLFVANYGGSEANVAISIANYGGEVDYVTRLPENALGENCITELRSHNVGTKNILLYLSRPDFTGTDPATAQPNLEAVFSIHDRVAELSEGSATSGFIVNPTAKNSGSTTRSGFNGRAPPAICVNTLSKVPKFSAGDSHTGENSTSAIFNVSCVILSVRLFI